MKTAFSPWLLAGALAASLSWNARAAWQAEAPATEAGCDLAEADLALTPEQRQQLSQCCTTSCADAEQLMQDANERYDELCARLSAPELDEEGVRALGREISDLRARSLDACIDSVLEMRERLGPDPVAGMIAACRAHCRQGE